MNQPIYQFTSHIQGKNARVTIFPDHIEWILPRGISGGKVAAGILTVGMSTLATGVRNGKSGSEIIPVKSISSVATKRDGMLNTFVQVFTSGNTIEFRVSHKEAETVKQVLMQLIMGSHPSQQVVEQALVVPDVIPTPLASPSPASPTAPAQVDIPAQLQQLAGLHAAGILTDEEFATKKAELLARM